MPLFPDLHSWVRTQGTRSLVLAVLFFLFGHASFLVQVEHAVVTPVLFVSEGIALALAIRYGAGVWPGVFAGQMLLALSRGLPLAVSLSIGASESLEAILAVFLVRRLGIDPQLKKARDLALLFLLVFLVLQPLSATGGNLALYLGGMIPDMRGFLTAWLNWWIGDVMAQTTVTPLLLLALSGRRRVAQLVRDLLMNLAILLPTVVVTNSLMERFELASIWIVYVPAVILIAISRGLAASCISGIIVAVCTIYATNHGLGPFFREGHPMILDLNVFILGLTMTGQFLAILLEQTRRQALIEKELLEARGKLERTAYELTDNIPVGTFTMVQPAGRGMAFFSFLSTRFLELTGLEREEAQSDPMKVFSCVHPEDRDEWVRKNAHVFEHMLPFHESCRVVVKGEVRWITAESTPRRLSDGSVVWEGVLTDITERKLAEQKLAESEAHLRRILDNIPIPLVCTTLEKESRITFLNEQFTRTFGYTLEDIPTLADWARVAYPDAQYRTEAFAAWDPALERAIRNKGTVESMEFHVTNKEGRKLDVLISAVVMEEMMLGCLIDVTERNRMTAELDEARIREIRNEVEQKRKIQQKLLSSLAASAIAHEINQPLASIMINSKIALEKLDSEDTTEQEGEIRPILENLIRESDHALSTIEKMKVLMRNVQTDHKPARLSTVVRSSLLQFKNPIADSGISVAAEGDESLSVVGDDAQIQLALINLIRNAIEGIELAQSTRREISIGWREAGDCVELTVGDSGPGWRDGAPPDETPLETTKPSGSGIGLFVVRTAVQNHGGSVSFGTSPLGGAEVKLSFPKSN
jgi:PAS domain S-box-containing protein